jgi:hypothetical protein
VRRVAAGLIAAATLAAPGTASAHLRTGRVAVDYRATIAPLHAPLAGAVEVRVYRTDLALGLTALGEHRIVVLGYFGEPFLRLEPGGIYVNQASTTAAGTGLAPTVRHGGAHWVLRSPKPTAIWHDARVRGAARGRWSVPLLVDGRQARLTGELFRVGPPAARPWLAIGACFAAVAILFLVLRSQRLLRVGAASLGALAALATLVWAGGLAASSTATGSIWYEAGNEALVAIAGLAFVAFGSWNARALAGGLLGVLGVTVGLTNIGVLTHGIVLSALPGQAARTAIVVALAAGTAAVVLGTAVFVDLLRHDEEPIPLDRFSTEG